MSNPWVYIPLLVGTICFNYWSYKQNVQYAAVYKADANLTTNGDIKLKFMQPGDGFVADSAIIDVNGREKTVGLDIGEAQIIRANSGAIYLLHAGCLIHRIDDEIVKTYSIHTEELTLLVTKTVDMEGSRQPLYDDGNGTCITYTGRPEHSFEVTKDGKTSTFDQITIIGRANGEGIMIPAGAEPNNPNLCFGVRNNSGSRVDLTVYERPEERSTVTMNVPVIKS